MTAALWLLVGVLIGAPVTLLAFTLATTAKRADAHLDPVSRRQAADEQRVWERINRNGADEETPHVN